MLRVHLAAGDGVGWAIDEDVRLVRQALAGACKFTGLARADVVHFGWWVNVLHYSRKDFCGRHVVCTAENAPYFYATEPTFLRARSLVTQWIVRSREAAAQFAALGIESHYAPYTFDPAVFRPLPKDDPELRRLAAQWSIPADKYVIANFHRDTEGADLATPKLQKGPDVFLEIVAQLHAECAPIHVLLAGPRRHWLRRQLAARGVPFTFAGEDTGARDDLKVNTLPRPRLNALYQLANLTLISSRWEGGPQSVLEAAATRGKVLSTRVGLAPDVLAPECLFASVPEACAAVQRDLRENFLGASVEAQHERVQAEHTEPALRRHLVEIYRTLQPLADRPAPLAAQLGRLGRRAASVLGGRGAPPPRVVALLHTPADSTPSALDTLLGQLAAALTDRGCTLVRDLPPSLAAPAASGKSQRSLAAGAASHDRTPDLILLGRGIANIPRGAPVIAFLGDESAAGTSSAMADAVVFPSFEALRRSAPRPHALVLAPALTAHREDDRDPAAPLRVAIACASHDREAAVAELQHACDEMRFTFPAAAAAHDAQVVWPGAPDPAGAVARALAAGIPVLYPADSQLFFNVWFGGLAYRTPTELPEKLETLRAHHAAFRRLAVPATIRAYAEKILRLAQTCRELSHDENRN